MNLICFSHLRWNFVYQRPQHILSRAAKDFTVYFIEEPVFADQPDTYKVAVSETGVIVIVPELNRADQNNIHTRHQQVLTDLFKDYSIANYLFWYYTPMMLGVTEHFSPVLTIYDCMDELSAFKHADPLLVEMEQRLFQKADVVFTGGESLYQSKKSQHPNAYCFPSSIDFSHFSTARNTLPEPADQQSIPHPRLGFFGVVDERFDIDLLKQAAIKLPDHHFVILGPVVKIDPATLPAGSNIHYLGSKTYEELPAYISGWDIALILFALNESTRFISPTKTPEYLAAGKPVISTAIADVVNPYGTAGAVEIVHSAEEFVDTANWILSGKQQKNWLAGVDKMLAANSWDITWSKMKDLINTRLTKPDSVTKKTTLHV